MVHKKYKMHVWSWICNVYVNVNKLLCQKDFKIKQIPTYIVITLTIPSYPWKCLQILITLKNANKL